MIDMDTSRFQNNTEYVSVVITTVKRPAFLKQCVDSIHKHADYPFEIIVVDDNGSSLESLNVKNSVSSYVLNMGEPMRQPVQQNRAIAVASSKYIIRIEDDCVVNRPCFKDIVKTLNRPYVGFINGDTKPMREHIDIDGTKFCLGIGVGAAWFNAFRKDVWAEVNGLSEKAHISNSVFCANINKHGYWRAYLLGSPLARNIDQEEFKGERSTNMCFRTAHYPKLFNIDPDVYTNLCSTRHVSNNDNYNKFRDMDGSITNITYWRDYRDSMIKDGAHSITSIDWEIAKKHGLDKWNDHILRDFNQSN